MAKCDICGRGANVQRIAVKTAGGSKKIHVCTRCMRSGKVERA